MSTEGPEPVFQSCAVYGGWKVVNQQERLMQGENRGGQELGRLDLVLYGKVCEVSLVSVEACWRV